MGFFLHLERREDVDVNYLVANNDELTAYQAFLERHQQGLNDYIAFLRDRYAVQDLPRVMILANRRSATEIIRQIPIPAYTNDIRLVMTPDLQVWQDLYVAQLAPYEGFGEIAELLSHYQNLTENHLLQIIGHELAHWSELFMDDFDDYDRYIWFEEGMVEYISRRYFLTEPEFEAEKEANQLLVKLFQAKYGWHSLNDFGQATYEGSIASIFYDYWRSFLTIDRLVETLGSVEAVFEAYGKWQSSETDQPLLDWFIAQGILEKEF